MGEQLSDGLFNGFMENLGPVFVPLWACIGLLLIVRASIVWQKSVDMLFYYIIVTAVFFSAWVGFRVDSLVVGLATLVACLIVVATTGVYYRDLRNHQLKVSGIAKIDEMSGEEFQLFLLDYFEKLGYQGSTTVKGNDYGADLVLSKDNSKTVVQAKRSDSRVGLGEVEEISGAIKYYEADTGMVITSSTFTSHARKTAASNQIELWDREALIKVMLESAAAGEPLVTERLSAVATSRACPKCGDMMIARQGKHGKFWGCESYPKCRHTEAFGKY